MRKWPTELEGLGSVSQTCPICELQINLYTCKSNEKELYLLKNLHSLQEGPVSNLQTRCVRADKGRERVFCYNGVCALLIEIHQVEMQI